MFNLQPPPVPVRRKLLDAVEAIRLAGRLLAGMDEDESADDDHLHGNLFAQKNALGIFVAHFEEVVGGVMPTVRDDVFAKIAMHKNRWPRNRPGSEAAAMALRLASDSLWEALDESNKLDSEWSPLDLAMNGAREVCNLFVDCMDGCIAAFAADESLALIRAGKPLPPINPQWLQDLVAAERSGMTL